MLYCTKGDRHDESVVGPPESGAAGFFSSGLVDVYASQLDATVMGEKPNNQNKKSILRRCPFRRKHEY